MDKLVEYLIEGIKSIESKVRIKIFKSLGIIGVLLLLYSFIISNNNPEFASTIANNSLFILAILFISGLLVIAEKGSVKIENLEYTNSIVYDSILDSLKENDNIKKLKNIKFSKPRESKYSKTLFNFTKDGAEISVGLTINQNTGKYERVYLYIKNNEMANNLFNKVEGVYSKEQMRNYSSNPNNTIMLKDKIIEKEVDIVIQIEEFINLVNKI